MRARIFSVTVQRWALAVLLFANLLAGGCADRQRSNPLDPKNPETGGRPQIIRAYSEEQVVVLKWQRPDVNGYRGMRIYRKKANEAEFEPVDMTADTTTIFRDQVEYGNVYYYTIQAVTREYESPFSDPVRLRPGPSKIWVALSAAGKVAKLSPDAAHEVFTRGNFIYPNSLAPAGYRRGVFVTDYYTSEVLRVEEDGTLSHRIYNIYNPWDIDVDYQRARIWVSERFEGEILYMDFNGQVLAKVEGLVRPSFLAVDQKNGFCWALDEGNGRVLRIDPAHFSVEVYDQLLAPRALWVQAANGACWIADSSRVLHLSSQGKLLHEIDGFEDAVRITVDDKNGDLWVVDFRRTANRSVLIHYSPSLEKGVEVDRFPRIVALDVDEYDGACVVADAWNYAVAKVDRKGNILGEWQTPGMPRDLRVFTP